MSPATFLIDSDDELTREVARNAGSASIDGRVVNAARSRAAIANRQPEPNPPAAPPPAEIKPGLSELDVRRLFDERDASWREVVDSLQRQVDLLSARVSIPRSPVTLRMKATYLADGEIDELIVTPVASASN